MSVFTNFSPRERSENDHGSTPLKVVEESDDAWKVALNIPARELVDQKALLIHLRKVKHEIALRYDVSESSLYFDGIVDRKAMDDAVDVIVNIRKQIFRRGAPRVHFRDGLRGKRTYANMVALLDILHLDPDNRPVSFERVMEEVARSGVDVSLVDNNLIAQKVAEVLQQQAPAVNIIVARGRFPESSPDAELKLQFPAAVSANNATAYISRRIVAAGTVICTKIPPSQCAENGMDVLGNILPAERGQDVELQTGCGVRLSPDGNEVVAEIDGRGCVTFRFRDSKSDGEKRGVPESALFKVNPVLTVKGDGVVSVSTSQAVHVSGDLHTGSRIVTEGDVYIAGNVAENSTIEAADDIVIEGSVRCAVLNSDASIITVCNVHDSQLTARGQIIAQGRVAKSRLVADTISVDQVMSSDLIARQNISLRTVDPDENDLISNICVGVSGYLKQRIIENRKYIEAATSGLERLETVFGREIVVQCDHASLQTMLMRFLVQMRAKNIEQRNKAEVYRGLMETIPPIKSLLRTKQEELRNLLHQLVVTSKDDGEISIRENANTSVHVSVDGIESTLSKGTGPVVVRNSGDGGLAVVAG